MPNWFDLNDGSGARLKLDSVEVDGRKEMRIFITNLSFVNTKWRHSIEKLGFMPNPSRSYLMRVVDPQERLKASMFAEVFPNIRLVDMDAREYMLASDPQGRKSRLERAVEVDLRGVKRLGRNARGEEVYEGMAGRFVVTAKNERHAEHESGRQSTDYLRLMPKGGAVPQGAELAAAIDRVADGFVAAMAKGEIQHSEDFDTFREAVGSGVQDLPALTERLYGAIDGAMVRALVRDFDVASDAYGPAARLYEHLPPYKGEMRGLGAMPLPLNVIAQRLLGDTADKTVYYPHAFDGAPFAFLAETSRIIAVESDGVANRVSRSVQGDHIEWRGAGERQPVAADAMFFNADPALDEMGRRTDYREALAALGHLQEGARAILVLASDSERADGKVSAATEQFLRALDKFSVDDVFEAHPVLSRKSGGQRGLRVFSVRAVEPNEAKEQRERIDRWAAEGLPVLASWDAIKTHVDELINRIKLAEAQSQSLSLERAKERESFQRPYLAFSKIGEARTMSPANMAAPAQDFLARLERVHGDIDGFVGEQLGMGLATLSRNFSPEQVDGVATMIHRCLIGRSTILADDTGIGKGRQLAALAVWANKQGRKVFFVSEKANLFSDLARDIKAIGEWDRFVPLVVNADGEVTVDAPDPLMPPVVLANGESREAIARYLDEGIGLGDIGRNICFVTYSQIAGAESQKAQWIKNQLSDALIIFDEAHVAAGSDSNVASHVSEMAAIAHDVAFSSATWAKTADNLHIFQRAFPESVSVATLAETMRRGGDSFSEIFSAMLAGEGALIRREHDLSKLEVEARIDPARERNEGVSDKVADVLGAAAYVAGEMQQVFIRSNAEQVRTLKAAREARGASIRAKLFGTSFGGGSVIYQTMRGVQGALTAEFVADEVVKAVRDGLKPVVVSDATQEALLRAVMEKDGVVDVDGRPTVRMPTLQDLLRHTIYRRLAMVKVMVKDSDEIELDDPEMLLPTAEDDADEETEAAADGAVVAEDDPGETVRVDQALQEGEAAVETVATRAKSKKKRRYEDVAIEEVEEMPQQAKEVYRRGLEEIEAKIAAVPPIPVSALDVIAQKLRDEGIVVEELTGRSVKLIRLGEGPGARWEVVKRSRNKKSVKATIRAFNRGDIDVTIINRSVASGVSMHASPTFADQRRRVMLEHQIPEDPVMRVQLLGRVNRYDQLSTPLIATTASGIYGELRYLMMQNRKLARMSANVRSSRDNAMLMDDVVDLFNSVGRDAVRGFLNDNPLVRRRLGIGADDADRLGMEIVNRVTMRVPLLRVSEQRMVYEDLYSRFDELVTQAQLEGKNPLRPNEMDVRAQTESEVVFFGDSVESIEETSQEEVVSAFDMPVMARRLKWTEVKNPLGFDAVKAGSEAAATRLVEKGYLVNESTDPSVLKVAVNPEILSKVVTGAKGMARLAHLASELASYEDAVLNNSATRQAHINYTWLAEYLKHLMPGAEVALASRDGVLGALHTTIVTDVIPPENDADLLNFGKWKLMLVEVGASVAKQVSLRSVLSKIEGSVILGEVTGDLQVTRHGVLLRPAILREQPPVSVINAFEFMSRGRVTRRATVLVGNAYQASEWSAAAGKGEAVVYTDQDGARHRGLLLPAELGDVDPGMFPVRVHDRQALSRVMSILMQPRDEFAVQAAAMGLPAEHVGTLCAREVFSFDTSFGGAWAQASNQNGRDGFVVMVPGKHILVGIAANDGRRMRAALAGGQEAIQGRSGIDPDGDEDSVKLRLHLSVKERNRIVPPEVLSRMKQEAFKSGAVLCLETGTPGQVARAVELLQKHAGLELYAAGRELKQLSSLVNSQVARERRAQRREQTEQLRGGRPRVADESAAHGPENTAPNSEIAETMT